MKTKKRSYKRGKGCGSKRGKGKNGCESKQVGGAAMCATGLCGASMAKMSSLLAAGSFGGYKILSSKVSMRSRKKGKKNNIVRHQSFRYEDNTGEEIDFDIKQKNKKITIKDGKKTINKTYKKLQSATNRYDRKIKACLEKGFDKC